VSQWQIHGRGAWGAIFCPFDICIHEEYMTFKPDMHEAPMATGVNAN